MRSPFAAATVLVISLACASGPSLYSIERDLDAGRIDEAVAKLEMRRAVRPGDVQVRMLLGDLYYQQARRALGGADEQAYTRLLGRAQDEVLAAVALRPEDPRPHTWMGIIAAYQGNLDSAYTSFRNARRLDPLRPISYTNLAHILVYEGELSRARRLLEKGRKLRAPQDELDRIEILAAWRSADFVEARDLFAMALDIPGFAETWDGAPLPAPMETFEDFASVCCSNPSCGPNMGRACGGLELEVTTRDLQAEAVLEELRLEMERTRRLREIYERRRDLEVVVEDEVQEEPAPPAAPER